MADDTGETVDETELSPHITLPPERLSPWKDWRFTAAFAGLAAAIAITFIAVMVLRLTNVAESNKTRNEQNTQVLNRLADNQAGINELVAFVHDVQKQQESSSGGTAQAVLDLERLLCASEDPVRIAACQQLGLTPTNG